MYCEHCGEKIPEYSRFCEQCGKPVTARNVTNLQSFTTVQPPAGGFSTTISKSTKPKRSSDYSRIAIWVRSRYGSRLVPGMDARPLRGELETILKSEQARIPAKALEGFHISNDSNT